MHAGSLKWGTSKSLKLLVVIKGKTNGLAYPQFRNPTAYHIILRDNTYGICLFHIPNIQNIHILKKHDNVDTMI